MPRVLWNADDVPPIQYEKPKSYGGCWIFWLFGILLLIPICIGLFSD
jgi:hypothetical protein